MNGVFTQIKPHKIPEEIVHQVTSLIKEGKLQPGQKLPSERALSDLFGVGRSSLREAINILETLGFVETRTRKGIFVRSVSSTTLSDPMRMILQEDRNTLYKLYELRKDLELASAFRAAGLCNPADLTAIRKSLMRMAVDAKAARLVLKADQDFHLAIARATHNLFRVHILKNIFDLAEDYMGLIVEKLIEEKDDVFDVFNQHEKIYKAIQDNDPERARRQMDIHLTWVEKKWETFRAEKSPSSP
jgi:GntR family transcriptional regulator, transcriptional repressor for pyruvate dehydrogenase complex